MAPAVHRYALYASHGLAAWGQRMWEFSVALVLLHQFPTSFAAVAAAGVVISLSQAFGGAAVGEFLDRTPRLRGATLMYLLQNISVACSACAALLMLALSPNAPDWMHAALAMGFIAGAGAADLGGLGSTLAVEREWVKLLAAGDSARLASMNAVMRRIDLCCLLLAPVAVGGLMTFVSTKAAVLLLAGWNVVAWMPECWLLQHVHDANEALRAPKPPPPPANHKCCPAVTTLPVALSTYLQQPCWHAALALALLYCTVLSFGLLSTAYLKYLGLSEAVVSVARGAGAVSGLLATLVYPGMQRSIGLAATGMVSIVLQWVCLAVAVAPHVWTLVLGKHALPAVMIQSMLIGGLVASRFGLWAFDLSVSQAMQEQVAAHQLGQVSGMQGALQQTAELSMYMMGIAMPAPEQYPVLMLVSFGCVTVALLLYGFWVVVRAPRVGAGEADPDVVLARQMLLDVENEVL